MTGQCEGNATNEVTTTTFVSGDGVMQR